jgi:hypothetical protein
LILERLKQLVIEMIWFGFLVTIIWMSCGSLEFDQALQDIFGAGYRRARSSALAGGGAFECGSEAIAASNFSQRRARRIKARGVG